MLKSSMGKNMDLYFLDVNVIGRATESTLMFLLIRQKAFRIVGSDGYHSEAHIALIHLSIRKQRDEEYAMCNSSRFIENLKSSFESSLIIMHPCSFVLIGLLGKDDVRVIEEALSAKAGLIVTDNKCDFPEQHLSTFGVVAVGPDDALTQCVRANGIAFRLAPPKVIAELNSTNFNEQEIVERWAGRFRFDSTVNDLRGIIEK